MRAAGDRLGTPSDLRETLVIVHVVWATPDVQDIVPVELSAGASVADAVRHSGLVAHYGLELASLRYARFGVRIDASSRLAEGDRVEIVRRLVVDPKAVRTARAGAKAAHGAARSGRRTP